MLLMFIDDGFSFTATILKIEWLLNKYVWLSTDSRDLPQNLNMVKLPE